MPYFDTPISNLLVVVGFILIHLTSSFLLLEKVNIHVMMSFAAGVGVSYALVHLLPKLAYSQNVLSDHFNWYSGIHATHAIYGIVLLGFVLAHVSDKLDEKNFQLVEKRDLASAELAYFWSDISFYAFYNMMIGYLVLAIDFSESFYLLAYFFAFGLHFLMNDWSLSHEHGHLYKSKGRKVLSLSILAGALLSLLFQLPYYLVLSIEAFITGAMLLTIIKFELPDGNQGSIKSFLVGTTLAGFLFVFI